MKQNCKWLAALVMAASASFAFGDCGFGSCSWSGWNVAPVGERVISYQPVSSCSYFVPSQSYTIRTIREPAIMPVGERFTTIRYYQPAMLEPVGERFTTVRVVRYEQPLLPVAERITTVKVIRHQQMLSPVGEKYSCKLIKHSKKSLHKKVTLVRQSPLPVAEKTIIRHHKFLKPVGEKTIIRTTTFRSTPSCGCGL